MGKGNLDITVDIKSNDEIGVLASTFNNMAANLKTSRKKIESHSKDLEKEVRKRTKELEEEIAVRKQAEEELKIKDQAIASSINAIAIAALDSRLTYVNPSFEKMFGYSSEELSKMEIMDLIPKESIEKATREIFPVTSEKGGWIGESTGLKKDGTIFPFSLSTSLVKDEKDNPLALLGSFLDITEEHQIKEALAKRVIALTLPLGDDSEVSFEDLFNLEEIQLMQDQFAEATGVASIISRPNGTPITKPSNFCRLCMDIIRPSEIGCRNCQNSDRILGIPNPGGPVVQPCKSGGLWDAGASIMIGGRHIATWLVGQVRNKAQNEKKYIAIRGRDRRG